MAQVPLATMRSRITGKMQTYTLSDQYAACTRFEADMDAVKYRIQEEFDSQGIDAQVESCKQLRGTFYDYILLETWVPHESPLAPATWTAILFIIKWVVVLVIAGIVIVSVLWAVRNYILGPYPKYVCDICGEEFDTLPALTAHRRTAHPEAPPYQCPYCGAGFNTAEELAKHVAECAFKPPAVPEWLLWVIALVGVAGGVFIVYELAKRIPVK